METEWYETHFQNVLTKTRPCRKPVETTSPKKYIKTRKIIPVVCPQGLNQTCFREVALPQVRNANQGFHSLECRVNPTAVTSGLASSPEIDWVWPTHINFTTPHKKEKRMVSFTKHSVWSVTMQLPCHNSCHWEISKCWLSHSKVGGHTTNPQIIFVPWCAKTVAGQLSPRTKTPCPFTTRKHSNHWVRSYFPGFFFQRRTFIPGVFFPVSACSWMLLNALFHTISFLRTMQLNHYSHTFKNSIEAQS